MSAAALHARHTKRRYLTRKTDVSSWRRYKRFLLKYLFYLEFADEIIFSRRRIILGTIVEYKSKNAYENIFQQVFHFSKQTYYKIFKRQDYSFHDFSWFSTQQMYKCSQSIVLSIVFALSLSVYKFSTTNVSMSVSTIVCDKYAVSIGAYTQ